MAFYTLCSFGVCYSYLFVGMVLNDGSRFSLIVTCFVSFSSNSRISPILSVFLVPKESSGLNVPYRGLPYYLLDVTEESRSWLFICKVAKSRRRFDGMVFFTAPFCCLATLCLADFSCNELSISVFCMELPRSIPEPNLLAGWDYLKRLPFFI